MHVHSDASKTRKKKVCNSLVTLASKCMFHLSISATKHLQSAECNNTGETFKTWSPRDVTKTIQLNQ